MYFHCLRNLKIDVYISKHFCDHRAYLSLLSQILLFEVDYLLQGPEHVEFVKAATTDNEIQFVETNDINIAKVLFPEVGTEKKFIGLVKSEPERYEKFGKLVLYLLLAFTSW